jgi:DNA repair protein RadC
VNANNHTASAHLAEPVTPGELKGLQNNALTDPYLLRGMVQCGLCRRELVAVLVSTGTRYYGCPTKQCGQTLVPAEQLEQLVWQRFTLLNEANAAAVKRSERRQALREVLKRVTVHNGLGELTFEWRD